LAAGAPRPPGADLPAPFTGLHAWPPSSIRGVDLPCCVSPSLCLGGSGLLTGCPSPTPCGLGLGPTNPTRTDLPSEPLGFRRIRFSLQLLRSHDAPLPGQPASQQAVSVASVASFSPVTFSAQDRLTSELLRTLSRVAASKPTSWLSLQSHIVSHLARTSGP